MAEKVIFLDIDGVLNDATTDVRTPCYCMGIDTEKVKILREIVEETGAEIVLTSTWKSEWDILLENRSADGLYLDRILAAENLQIFDKTEDKVRDRGQGIRNWLAQHPEVEKWVVLDDEVFPDFKEFDIMPHLVKTQFIFGLTPEHVSFCVEMLNGGAEDA